MGEYIIGEKTKKKKQDETFNMVIEADLKKQFNIKCIENGTNMSKELKKFIQDYVK